MASSEWKEFISFGLVSIPVKLYAAARSKRIQLHQLHSVLLPSNLDSQGLVF